ncbi:MAG: AbrB/MazE/SpoVT family DNA-binding domain-containing protein [Nitrososphaerales archaeon]|nr:AbrB/MazE/SpoVT family DNA-binding domain-containing protein [Nitrososphaerales archaeon]
MGEATIDERGRIVIPHEIRDKLKLRPEQRLRVEVKDDGLLIRPYVSTEEFIREMRGCVSGSKVSPERLKEIWGARHPHN